MSRQFYQYLCLQKHQFYRTLNLYLTQLIFSNSYLRKSVDSFVSFIENRSKKIIILTEFYFINFLSKSSRLIFLNLIRCLIWLHISSYFFSLCLLSLVGTSVKYLFLLLLLLYSFELLIRRCKGFTLFGFTYAT